MFCPRCGSTQSEELKFCKQCGANLQAVRQAVDTRESGEKFEWSKTWVADMLRSGDEPQKRVQEIDHQRGLTPEVLRYREIKAGVITTAAGVGTALLLFVLMEGIVRSGNVTPGAAEILSRIWVAGLIPVLVGIALIVNGLFVSKKLVELAQQTRLNQTGELRDNAELPSARSAVTARYIPSGFSVTEGTTKHLGSSGEN